MSAARGATSVLLVLLCPTLLSLQACSPPETAAPPAPSPHPAALGEEERDALYAVGAWLAGNLAGVKIEERDLASIEEGLRDGLLRRPLRLEPQSVAEQVQELIGDRRAELALDEKRASAPFLEEARREPGAERSASGLVFRELTGGEGDPPGLADRVRVRYEGTLRDGTLFDGTGDKGPAVFGLTTVVPCWTEALRRMRPGGVARITCPSDLAYGDRGIPGRILPGAALRFEIEMLEVLPGGARDPKAGAP